MYTGIHHLNTRRKAKKQAKKMAKKLAKKYIQDELKRIGYNSTITVEKKESKFTKFMNKAIFGIALVGPVLTLPQIWNVWIHHSAQGLSIYTRGAYTFSSACRFIYAVLHKEKTLMFNYTLRFLANLAVLLGIIIYG